MRLRPPLTPPRDGALGPRRSTAAEMHAALLALFAAGAGSALVGVVLERLGGPRQLLALGLLGFGVVASLVLFVRARRTPAGLGNASVHAALAVALGVVTATVWCCDGSALAVATVGYFSWVPLGAFAVLERRQAMPYLAAASLACVAVIVSTIHVTPVGCAVDAVGTMVAGAMCAGYFRAMLVRAGVTDALTRLPNRQALPAIVEREIARATRFGTPLTIAVFDVDHFKEVNDTEGHRAGDRVLCDLAGRWRRALRPGDELVRYGGDEFVAVLPGATTAGGVRVADLLRQAGGHPSSAGVAQWVPGESADTTIARADAALYRAKAAGRDQVAAAEPFAPAPNDEPRVLGRRRFAWLLLPAEHADDDPAGRVEALVRVIGVLYVAAGVIYLPQILFDPVPGGRVVLAAVVTVGAVVLGSGLLAVASRFGDRLSMWMVHACVVVALVAIGVAAFSASGGPEGIVALSVFTWVWLLVFTALAMRTALVYCALGSAVAVGTVAQWVDHNPAGVAIVVLATALGIAALVVDLRVLLQRASLVDTVTGLFNRGMLERALAREIGLADRTGAGLSVAIVDLDRFKEVNDTSGHLAGDRLLEEFAGLWQRELRTVDTFLRYGGDEFVVLLPGCDVDEAALALERLRCSALAACSVGVTAWDLSDSTETLLARADRALYEAKAAGRDRVVAVPAPTAG